MRALAERAQSIQITVHEASLQSVPERTLRAASLLILDIDLSQQAEKDALLSLRSGSAGSTPVLMLTQTFDESIGRLFIQLGIADFLRKPVEAREILDACVRILSNRDGTPDHSCRITTFVPAAGGVGNTTMAIEAAIQMAEKSKTCLVDLDFQNDACVSYLDVDPLLDFDEIGEDGERLDQQMLEVMTARHQSGLDLISAPAFAYERASNLPAALIRLLDVVASKYENVVIDMPRNWAPWFLDVMRGSDQIYIVTDFTVPGLRSARRLADRIAETATPMNEPKVIINRFQKPKLFGGGLSQEDATRAMNGHIAGYVRNDYGLVREAIDRGVPLKEVKHGNNVSHDVREIIFV